MTRQKSNAEELAWWVALHGAENVGPATFHRLVHKFGSPGDVLRNASADTLVGLAGASSSLLDSLVFAMIRMDHTRKVVEKLISRGVRIITFKDAEYPARLNRLRWPPALIFTMGAFSEADAASVSIAGSTHPSARGFRTAYRIAGALAARGHTIVSGNARGIDTAAHLGALDANGRSVFVPPEGILNFRTHAEIPHGKLERNAVVLSDRPPEAQWTREGALERNRVIAALCESFFVVEALPDGGAIHAFRIARKLGVPSYAVSYSTDTPAGNLQAIHEGAGEVKSLREAAKAAAEKANIQPQSQQTFDWNDDG